jgi:GDP-L-fucose synthase
MPEAIQYDLTGKRVWVAGHGGMVGSAIVRRLGSEGCEILAAPRNRFDLRSQNDVKGWMAYARPHAIFVAAARVGGINANATRPAEFIADNLMIQTNVIDAAWQARVEKLLFLGSSCIYPRLARQPMAETELLSGPLEPTNQWYAVAKIAGLKMCEAYRRQYGCDFISAMPTNLYGAGDNYDLESSHVVAALLAKAHMARVSGAPTLRVWGDGSPLREFLFVDDAADALVFLMKHYSADSHINVGTGEEVSVAELAHLVCRVVGFRGTIAFDASKPNGTPRKLLDVGRLSALGWRASTPLEKGLELAYRWYAEHTAKGRVA